MKQLKETTRDTPMPTSSIHHLVPETTKRNYKDIEARLTKIEFNETTKRNYKSYPETYQPITPRNN